MDTTDELIRRLGALKKALADPNTWSLEPLAGECQSLIDLRQTELGKKPKVEKPAMLRHGTDGPITLEERELWA